MTSAKPGTWVEINVGDKSMPVYVSTPAQGKPKAAVVVLQEIFGVNAQIRSLTDRFAAEGYLAIAPDLFHRQGNRFEGAYEDMPRAIGRAQRMSEEQALEDIDRVIANLAHDLKVGAVGFCMGGRIAFQASFNARVSGAVSFYGGRTVDKLKWADQVGCPLLFFFGEKDKHIPASEISEIREKLHGLSKEHEIVVYPSAGHAFMRDASAAYEPQAANDAWKRTTEFFARTLR